MKKVEEELKRLILERYKSLREFSFIIDMPYSTLDSVLRRGVSNSSVSNAITICNELQVDTESLVNGKVVPKVDMGIETIAAHHDGDKWTTEELDEIEQFKEFVKAKRQKNN